MVAGGCRRGKRLLEPGGLAAIAAVVEKELRVEWRGRELLPTLAQFCLLAVVIANFAFDLDPSGRPAETRLSAGILWMVVVFAALVAFGRSFSAERDQSTVESVILSPNGALALVLGKAISSTLLLLACEAVVVAAMVLLLSLPVPSIWLVAALVLGTVGLASVGCLLAAVALQTRGRELLLPALVLPLWIPVVIFGAQAIQAGLSSGGGAWWPPPGAQSMSLLLALDILLTVIASLAARFALDD